jgi:hypothetical protein
MHLHHEKKRTFDDSDLVSKEEEEFDLNDNNLVNKLRSKMSGDESHSCCKHHCHHCNCSNDVKPITKRHSYYQKEIPIETVYTSDSNSKIHWFNVEEPKTRMISINELSSSSISDKSKHNKYGKKKRKRKKNCFLLFVN